MELRGKTVLVTGGAGFIGSHLVDVLLQEGASVRVLDNLANGHWDHLRPHGDRSTFAFQLGSITDPFDVNRALRGIDVVYHLACLGVRHSLRHPFENHRVNAEGTLLVLQAALDAGVERFVCCSSSEVYGTAVHVPMAESHPPRPCTVYGASKLAGEAYARSYFRAYGLPTVVVRPFNTYGPRSHHEGDAGELIPKCIVRALANEPILVFGDGTQTRDFTYVEDTARALVLAGACDGLVGETVNVGSDFEVSIGQIAERIQMAVDAQATRIEYVDPRPGDVLRLYADSSRFRGATGWTPSIGLDEGLARTITWFSARRESPVELLAQEGGRNW